MSINFQRNKRGFSLAEIMIIISIVGLLTAIVSASVISARMKARDDRRIADMRLIQIGLALYHDVYRKYPLGDGDASLLSNPLVSQQFLPVIPDDPDVTKNYEYKSDEKTYCLGIRLERSVPAGSENCISMTNNSQANYKVSR